MKSAEGSLISEKDLKSETLFRLIPSRSYLFRHHMDIYPRNLWRSTSSLKSFLCRGGRERPTVAPLIRSTMSEQRPDRARHLVGQRHNDYVRGSPREQPFKPRIQFSSGAALPTQDDARPVYQ